MTSDITVHRKAQNSARTNSNVPTNTLHTPMETYRAGKKCEIQVLNDSVFI